jgi:hypothetical protein
MLSVELFWRLSPRRRIAYGATLQVNTVDLFRAFGANESVSRIAAYGIGIKTRWIAKAGTVAGHDAHHIPLVHR